MLLWLVWLLSLFAIQGLASDADAADGASTEEIALATPPYETEYDPAWKANDSWAGIVRGVLRQDASTLKGLNGINMVDHHWCQQAATEEDCKAMSAANADDFRRQCAWCTLRDNLLMGPGTCMTSGLAAMCGFMQTIALGKIPLNEVHVPRGTELSKCFLKGYDKETCEGTEQGDEDNDCMFCELKNVHFNIYGTRLCLQKSLMRYLCYVLQTSTFKGQAIDEST